MTGAALQLWGGAECTVNRVGDRVFDQLELTGHADRPDDLDRFAGLGLRTLRVALLWERIEIAPGRFDWRWADALMARLRRLGINPIVGLVHHGSGPRWTDLTRSSFATGLADHAARVAARYPWVRDWTPVNEPLTTARCSCLYGLWHPHLSDDAAFWGALLTQIEATALAMANIRKVIPEARLIQTEDFGRTWATAPCQAQATFENRRRLMTWDLQCGRVDRSHPLAPHLADLGLTTRLAALVDRPTPPDVIGLNHYVTSDRFLDHRLDRYPAPLHGGNGRIAYADTEAVRAVAEWTPGWRRDLSALHARYGLPVAVTECHLGCDPAQQTLWLNQCWRAALQARDDGVPVEAVTVWALAGSVGWDRLLTRDGGRYEPGVLDASAPGAPETALGAAVRRLAAGRSLPADPPPGWWDRPDRLVRPLTAPLCPEPLVA
ncbi:MAG: glycosyl hydrolase family protein [Brevundimonas sp.]|nr:MAG: glycosyl hydrolase family protein [Brevundimonas sp.]